MKNSLITQLIILVLLIAAQVFVFGWLNIYNYAFCFAFITYIITISPKNGLPLNLFIAFALGLVIDYFNYSLGVNAFCCLTLAYLRNPIFGLLKGLNAEEQLNTEYTLTGLGTPYFMLLVFVCSTLYAILYFFLSTPEWIFFQKNILRALASALLTTAIILSINILFFKRSQSR